MCDILFYKIIYYFTHLYNSEASSSVFNSSKIDFSHIVFLPAYLSILEHPQTIKYFKGVDNLSPPTQKIMFVWDVRILFDYFSHKGKNDQVSDKRLTQKLLILLLLLGGQRLKTVYFFKVGRMTVAGIGVTSSPNHVLKGLHFHIIMFLNIQNREKSWIVSTVGHNTTKSYVLQIV